MSRDLLMTSLEGLVETLDGLDLNETEVASAELERLAPLSSEPLLVIRSVCEKGLEEGWLVPKENAGIRFGRVCKDLGGWSVDAVVMSGPGPRHRHPLGEVDLCFALSGEPRFEGQSEGWVVLPPDSVHVPAVKGGEMLILYFLPQGQIEFLES